MNTTRKDTSKLLVTIMAIAMIFVGCAVLASSSGSNAADPVVADSELTADSSVSFTSGDSTVYYDTLNDAISAIQPETATTITLLKDTEGIGIKIQSNCNVIIDFNNFTYNVTKTVGSTGTETNAVQLLKDSTVVFKNGILTSDNALRMIQNYTDLTLENMTIDASKMLPGFSAGAPVDYIAIASNNGDVFFKGTTSIIDKDASNDTTGRTAVSLAVSYWHPNYPDGTIVTFDEGFSGTVGDIIVTGTEGFSEAGKISKLVINSTEGKFGSIDATYGAIEIGESAEISTTSFSIGSDVTVTNNGKLTAENLLISGTLTNNGTIACTSFANIGTINGTPGMDAITIEGSIIAQGASTDGEFQSAMKDENVQSVVITGGNITVSGEIVKPVAVLEGATLTSNNDDPIIITADTPISVQNGTITGPVINAGNTIDFNAVAGSFTVSYGSVKVDGTITNGTLTVSGETEISGTVGDDESQVQDKTLTIEAGESKIQYITVDENLVVLADYTLSIGENVVLVVPEKATLTINGTLNVDGGLAVYGTVDGTGSISGDGQYALADGATTTGVTFGSLHQVSIFTFENATGLNQNLEANYTVTSKAFLEKDLTINEGVTLSIANGATLDLNGYTLTVLGTLEVAGNGSIDSSIADGTIALGARAVVNNSGVIGSTNAVSVELSPTIASVDGRVIVPGAVDLKNVTGVSFGYKRVVSDDVAYYYLTISGSAAKKGTVNGTMTVNGTVYTGSEFTIGNRVTLTGSTLVVDQNAVMTVSTNGVLGNSTASNTVVDLLTGATLNIDGAATATITADTGDYNANVTGTPALAESSVKLTNVKGIVLTVTSEDYTEKNVLKTAQRLDMSGALDNAADGDAKVEIGGTANRTNFVGVVVSDTLTVNKDISTWTVTGAKFTVTGTVSYTELAVGVDLTSNLEGAVYTVQNEVNGARVTTTYITSFASAVANIANVYETMIEVYGDTVKIETGFELGVDQIINMGDGQTVKYTIPSDVEVIIGNDATFNATKITVEGVLVVMVDGYTDADLEYAVYSEDDIGNRTYSGFKVALDNAQPGDVITIDKTANVTEDVIIPAQVTVNITDTGELNVKTDSNGNPSDLTVEGTLNNEGVLTVTGDMTVTGTADLTEGVTNSITGDVSVTGTMTTVKSFAPAGEISAVRYTNEDGYYVYTDLTKAVAAVSAFDVNRNMELVGTVSDNSAVTLTDMTLTVTGTARMGTITLDGSSVVVNGTFTGTIAGQSGEEGSTVATAVTLTAVKGVTIESDSSANESNVQVYSTDITLNTEGANANTYLVGDISIDAGTVNLGSMSVGATGTAPNNTESTISVTSGATTVIGQGIVINAGADADGDASIIITGTLQVRGTFNVNGVVDVAGTMNIAKTETADQAKVTVVKNGAVAGVLNISGTVTVSEENNLAGTLEVDNIMAVSGSVSGPVALGESGYLKAYATATLNDAKIDWNDNTSESEADVTAFYINGEVYMTIYAVDGTDVKYSKVIAAAAEDFDVPGFDTSNANSLNDEKSPATNYWFTDADLTKGATDNEIGTDAALYFKAPALTVEIRVSVGSGISIYIDDIRYDSGWDVPLSVGTHTVTAVVNPGFTGDVTITFNGQTITNGQFEITTDMASASYDGPKAISATGNITQDSTVVIDGGSSSDSGMGLTDYLLIILVILIVVMAIIVALRLMRS